jgi:hypothetical protein
VSIGGGGYGSRSGRERRVVRDGESRFMAGFTSEVSAWRHRY